MCGAGMRVGVTGLDANFFLVLVVHLFQGLHALLLEEPVHDGGWPERVGGDRLWWGVTEHRSVRRRALSFGGEAGAFW